MAKLVDFLTSDGVLLLDGVSNGYPLPSQHPSRVLNEGDGKRFWEAVARCMAAGCIVLLNNNHFKLTEAGRRALQDMGGRT